MLKLFKSISSKLKLNPSLTIVIIEGFFARLGFGVITFALPFFALSLGMSFAEIGLLAATRLIAAIIFKPIMGQAADRFGKKNVYAWSIAGRTLVGVLLIFATQPWMLFTIRIFHGVTTAARDPSSAFLIAEHGQQENIASAFAWYGTAREAGAAIGFLVAGFLLTYSGDNYPLTFSFSVLTSLIALFIVLVFVKENKVANEKKQSNNNSVSDNSGKIKWIEIATFGLFAAFTGSMVTNLFPVIATEVGQLSKAETSVIVSISTLVIIFAGPWFGWLSDHVSRKLVLSIRACVNALSSILYIVSPNFLGICAARISDDAGKAAFRPAWGSLMAEISHAKKEQRGKTIANMDTAQSIGEALGPVVAGILWDNAGIVWLFLVRILFSILTEFYAILILKSNKF